MTRVLGWDVGGANVKAAVVEGDSFRAVTRALALWRDPDALPAVLREVAAGLDRADAAALTMTAELADCFATRAEGVGFVLDAFDSAFPEAPVRVFGTDGRFRTAAEARRDPIAVASANWRATAEWLARRESDAILIDVGSTTTDVVPIVGGEVAAEGWTDFDRLAAGELVYTGAVRTPCAAIARRVRLGGRRHRLAAELFAQSGDVHLWLGRLPEHDYTGDTPDGRGKTREEAAARLARMAGSDAALLGPALITEIAHALAEQQVRQIASAIRQVRARLGARAPRRAVTLGLGAFLGRAAAERAGLEVVDGAAALGAAGLGGAALGAQASAAAPAVAVAALLLETLG